MPTRPRPSRPPNDAQLPLPFTRTPDVVRDLRSIDQRATLTKSPKLFRQWRELVIAVAFLERDGRPATWQKLASLASTHEPGLIVSERTFKRAHAEAVRNRVLTFDRTADGTVRRADRDTIAELVRGSQELHAEDRAREKAAAATGPGAKSGPETPEKWPRDNAKVALTEPKSGPETICAFELHSDASRGKRADGAKYGPELTAAIARWMKHKADRREAYKPTGLEVFHAQVARRVAEHGEAAVAAKLEGAISNNYQGWNFSDQRPGGVNSNRSAAPPSTCFAFDPAMEDPDDVL